MKKANKYKRQSLIQLLVVIIVVVLVNILFVRTFHRFDLTEEKRYSVSNATRQLLTDLESNIYIRIFLAGDLPADYQRLANELKNLLEEYQAYTDEDLDYVFNDPFAHDTQEEANKYIRSLVEQGLQTQKLSTRSAEGTMEKYILPGMIIAYGNKEIAVNLLPEQQQGSRESIGSAISTLEFKLSNALRKLQQNRNQRIAFIQGHGELPTKYVADLAVTLQQQQFDLEFIDLPNEYVIDPLTDVVIIAKPTRRFSERDKFKLDQYIMNGGKAIWLIDGLAADLDSLRGKGTEGYVTQNLEFNLEDQLFNYGARINPDLIQDMQCAEIPLGSQYEMYSWSYFPVITPLPIHPVVKHLEPVITQFVSSIDTIGAPGIEKTVLLSSSANSRVIYHPVPISLRDASKPRLPEMFNKSNIPLAVLLEGEFLSIFRNRPPSKKFLRTYEDSLGLKYREQSKPTQMVVISDGEMIKNEIGQNNFTYPLGFYKYQPNRLYANKTFLLNVIDFLTDPYGLVETRNKEFKIRPLSEEGKKAAKWPLLNIIIPVLFILIFGAVYHFIRKRKYQ